MDRDMRERREAFAAEQWRLARRSLKRTANALIVLGLIVCGFIWYCYFIVLTHSP